MPRYVSLYLNFIKFSCSKAMFFRFDFWLRILMDLVYYTVSISFFQIVYLQTPSLAGWTKAQTMILVGSFLLIDALQMTIFSSNMWNISQYVRNGNLDYYLTKPISTLFFISLEDFAPNSLLNVFAALGILGWAFHQYTAHIPVFWFIAYVILLANGLLLHYLLRLLLILPVFWTQSVSGFEILFFSFVEVMDKPDRIFRGVVRTLFLTIIPLSIIVAVPARVLFEGLNMQLAIQILLVTFAFVFIDLFLWNRGLRAYSSASS